MNAAKAVGFTGYYITATGSVWTTRRGRLRKMRPAISQDGYPQTVLYDASGRRVSVKVHRLVAEAFIGTRPAGADIRHLDGDMLNNSPSNLAYGTRMENIHDSLRLGRHQYGERSGFAKLTNIDVQWMRVYHRMGFIPRVLGEVFGVGTRPAWCAVTGRTWKRVQP